MLLLPRLRRRKTILEPALCIAGALRSCWGGFLMYSRACIAAAGASYSRGSSSLVANVTLRMTFRIDGPHLRTRGRALDGSNPDCFLQRRLVSRETQQMRAKPAYKIAAISGTVGRSEMTEVPCICFVHPFHFSGFGGDVRMTRTPTVLKSYTSRQLTTELLSTRTKHPSSLAVALAVSLAVPFSSKMQP